MESPSRLRIVTINIWNRSGPWAERLPLLREEIRALGPDVVGLQEVLRPVPPDESPHGAWSVPDVVADDGATDQASLIAAGMYPHVAYASATDFGHGLSFGNAVLSRYPIVKHREFTLPGRESGETRALLYALVEHPAGKLPIFVTHLNWKLHHGNVRVRQVRFIAQKIFELAPLDEPSLPPVLMGDFNAEPDSDEIRFLKGLATIDGGSVYLADAWTYGGDGTAGYTFDRRNRFAAVAHEPPRRIDYVFVRGPDRALRGEPLETRVVFSTPTEGATGPTWPSDHFGLVTDLSVEGRSLE
jgi:endonuclease/exonuclease/phosphatase family metal-dependent hydrolase